MCRAAGKGHAHPVLYEHVAAPVGKAAVQQHEAREAARTLSQMLTERLPEGSTLMIVDMDPVLAVHSGPGAVAVSMVYSADAAELTGGISTGD